MRILREGADLEARLREYQRGLRLILKNPLTMIGLAIIIVLIFIALFAPQIAPYPDQGRGASDLSSRLLPPTFGHLFGTDNLGRDICSRIIFGARVSLKAALIVVLIVVAIGMPLGVVAGYYGGKIDEAIMRTADMILAFPSLLLAIAIVAATGPSLTNAMIAVSVPWWPWYTRLARSQTVSLRERQFVEAAKAVGMPNLRIIFRHIVPNCLSPIIVQATLDMGYVILSLAGLGFLGLGTQPPRADWGVMVSAGREFFLNQWWYSTFPGLAIFITVLGFNILGDGLREALDPRIRWKFK